MATFSPLANTPQALTRQQSQLLADIVRSNIALLGYTSIACCCKHFMSKQSGQNARMHDYVFVASLAAVLTHVYSLQPCPGLNHILGITSVASTSGYEALW